ncbi:DUF6190 family protein [Pseudomonas asplenii]|uniref:DUF6190 family protein n=1 Tax=Pseudomonas asplenii TaxID=53407 RepID=UPI002234E15E|nr:DUF6190 family protein [Pseudomonas asplenii]UZE31187.1 DUF6190 family protein [Pseudomonas asplenii]
MLKGAPIIDATVFMGMHHADDVIRDRSLAFFTHRYDSQVRMTFSQVGLCDAIIWKKARELQDVYYPFMDVLHSDMNILRSGYTEDALRFAADSSELAVLPVEKRLQAAQVLMGDGLFYTHDTQYQSCPILKPYLATFSDSAPADGVALDKHFPAELQKLYVLSLALKITDEDFKHV